ncbi:hypothetical protein KY284_010240 [Solanum tuberosum]|nr:hypothetical protein KY284_010240 [Solanum tuberosum]
MIPNGMLNGRNESSPTKMDKICESEGKNKLSEDDEGWTTVSKGKGKIKKPGTNAQGNQKNITTENQGNNDQGNHKNIATENQFAFPPNEVANMTNDRQGEASNTYGITFTSQEKTNLKNISSKRGKRKVTATPRWLQENANQATVRKARMQKKVVETFNPPYERRTRSKKGNMEEGDKKDAQQMDNNTDPPIHNNKEENNNNVVEDTYHNNKLVNMGTEENLAPVDRGKKQAQYPKKNNNTCTNANMEDEYNHYESALEEEMEEDHFHDIPDQLLEGDINKSNGENQGVISIPKETNTNEQNLYSISIKLVTEGTSLTDKDCSMVDSNSSSQNNMLSSNPNSS